MFRNLLLLLLLSLPARALPATDDTSWRGVSIASLVTAPHKYHGKKVVVRGFVRLEFEGSAIYLHEDDYTWGIPENGIWLNGASCKRADGTSFRTGYAIVTGIFSANDHGHMGMWEGELAVSKCTELFARKRG